MDIEKSVNFSPLSPLSFLERNQWVYKNKEAIMYGLQKYSYVEFSDRIQRCASALKNTVDSGCSAARTHFIVNSAEP